MSGPAPRGDELLRSERGTGEPVVFVHGIPTDYRAWDAQVAALSDRFRTIAYSRRYASPNRREGDLADSTIENNALDLQRLVEGLGAGPVHLVGHSYGGFIGAYLASRHPDLLRSLVLVEPALAPLLLRDPNSRAQALSLLLRHPGVAASAARYLRVYQRPALRALERGDGANAVRLNVNGVEDRDGAFADLSEPVRRMMVENARTVKETELPYPALDREDLHRIRVPTLVLNGETSALWLRRVGEIAGQSVPNCERTVISGAGHYPHLQRAAEVNSRLLAFLDRFRSLG
jgi:pimeloyl-ACP methyl ester carboxylesterase